VGSSGIRSAFYKHIIILSVLINSPKLPAETEEKKRNTKTAQQETETAQQERKDSTNLNKIAATGN
jgi:hypothetical protein